MVPSHERSVGARAGMRFNPVIKAQYAKLIEANKPHEVSLIAWWRNPLAP